MKTNNSSPDPNVPAYGKDLGIATLFLIGNDLKNIIPVSNSGSCTWREFAQKILELIGSQLKLTPNYLRPVRTNGSKTTLCGFKQ